MLRTNPFHFIRSGRAVPNPFGVDHNGGTKLALVETARAIHSNPTLPIPFLPGGLEPRVDVLSTASHTATAAVTFVPVVKADKDVVFVDRHGRENMQLTRLCPRSNDLRPLMGSAKHP
jgi:hypothetical protein